MQFIKHKIKLLDVFLTLASLYCIASLIYIGINYKEFNVQPSEEPPQHDVYNITLVNIYDNKSCK